MPASPLPSAWWYAQTLTSPFGPVRTVPDSRGWTPLIISGTSVTSILEALPPGSIRKDLVAPCGERGGRASMRRQMLINAGTGRIWLPPAILGFNDRIRGEHPIRPGHAQLHRAETCKSAERIDPGGNASKILVTDVPLIISGVQPRESGTVRTGPNGLVNV